MNDVVETGDRPEAEFACSQPERVVAVSMEYPTQAC